jgi:hypothetical protein
MSHLAPTLDEWRADASTGKDKRLRFLLRTLGMAAIPGGDIRYQFLHRAASANNYQRLVSNSCSRSPHPLI